MTSSFLALTPLLLVIASGYLISRTGIITGDQWRGIERLVYYALLPTVLFRSIALTDFTDLPALDMCATLLCTVAVMAALLLWAQPRFEKTWGIQAYRFTSIFQGTLRLNVMIALAIVDSLAGPVGVTLLAVAIAFLVPISNIASIAVLSWYGSSTRPTARQILKDLLTNPFILSILAGIAFNLTGLSLPAIVDDKLELLERAALPVGLMCVGAHLKLNFLRRPGMALTIGAFIRPVLMPILAFVFAKLFGITDDTALMVIIIACSVPPASAAYLQARQMGGDAELMAEIITLQTLLAKVSIPVALLLVA